MIKKDEDDYLQIKEWLDYYSSTENKIIKKYLKNLIVMACQDLVRSVSIGMARKTTYSHEDFVQNGYVGLMKAIDFYRPRISTKFKTYATYFIMGEIKHYMRDKLNVIKPPRRVTELVSKITGAMCKLIERGDDPSLSNLSLFLNVPIGDLVEVIEIDRIKNTLSLDQSLLIEVEEDLVLSEKVVAGDYEQILEIREEKMMLMDAIKKLPYASREIIRLSYYEDLNQREIAARFHISQMQVSRRLKIALNELYEIVTRDYAEIAQPQ